MSALTIEQAFQLAIAHQKAGRLAEAEAIYRQILAVEANHVDALHYLGVVAHQVGRNDVAVELITKAIALRPDYAEAHSNLSNALKDKGELGKAIATCRRAIALRPELADAHSNLGNILKESGKLDEAIAAYRRAIALMPSFAEAQYNLAIALIDIGQTDGAIAASRKAIALRPNFTEAYNNLGIALKDKGQLDEAVAAYRQAIALRPDYAEAHTNLGVVLRMKGQLDAAIAAQRQAIALRPNYVEAHNNLGGALTDKGQLSEAIAVFRDAIALSPDYAELHGNLAVALLLQGGFVQGWEEYEWRWKLKEFIRHRRNFTRPVWDGNNLVERAILLHAEQGFGDALQFIRYLPLVQERCGSILIECQPELQRLLQANMSKLLVVGRGQTLPTFDVHCPLMSLPDIFATDLTNIPRNMPYLHANATDTGVWRTCLAYYSCSVKVGLVWAGNPAHTNDSNRSLKLANLAPLFEVPGKRFFSLQKGEAASEARTLPVGTELTDVAEELKDFADTAALIANLDLVIAVDTAVVHLAGAMGRPVWTLLPFAPDWRWLLDRSDSPWYPTMRLFRQSSPGDWDSVIRRVAGELAGFRA